MNRRQILFLLVVGALVVLVLVVGGGGGGNSSSPTPDPDPAPTTARLFPNIERESDCAILQDIFDNAERGGDGARERGDLELAREHTEAMRRADDRMSEVGCY